jgi:hypothetical protein
LTQTTPADRRRSLLSGRARASVVTLSRLRRSLHPRLNIMSGPSFSQRRSPGLVIVGTFIDTPLPRTLRVRRNHYCIVSPETGRITHLAPVEGRGNDALRILGDKYREYDVVWLLSSQFVCPGMIDTHCHAPQYRQLGSANNLPLVSDVESLMAKCSWTG